jgi:putative transposase
MISERLIGRKISPAAISSVNTELNTAVEAWRWRDLSQETVKCLFIDGVHFHMPVGRSIDIVPVPVAIGATETGQKLALSLQAGDKKSATSWWEFFKDLKARGLAGGKVTLGMMDGFPGLETVFQEEFPRAKVQRCQVHVARNVLAKAPKKFKQDVTNDIRSVLLRWNHPPLVLPGLDFVFLKRGISLHEKCCRYRQVRQPCRLTTSETIVRNHRVARCNSRQPGELRSQ